MCFRRKKFRRWIQGFTFWRGFPVVHFMAGEVDPRLYSLRQSSKQVPNLGLWKPSPPDFGGIFGIEVASWRLLNSQLDNEIQSCFDDAVSYMDGMWCIAARGRVGYRLTNSGVRHRAIPRRAPRLYTSRAAALVCLVALAQRRSHRQNRQFRGCFMSALTYSGLSGRLIGSRHCLHIDFAPMHGVFTEGLHDEVPGFIVDVSALVSRLDCLAI